jgi:colanic acid biosynthesis glycosyl transferase WcaI
VEVIPNWVDTDVLKPGPKDNPLSRKHALSRKYVVMYSGTLSISSNRTLGTVLEAARLLASDRSIVLVIVGEGLKKPDLVDKASRLDLKNVRFLPFQPYHDLPRLLASADILLVPLDQEKSFLSVPSKLYNFIAAGRVVLGVADGSSEVAEAIASMGCGLCVPPDSAAGIAAAVRKLKKAPGLARKLGAGGRAYAEKHFSRRTVLRKYEELLSRL